MAFEPKQFGRFYLLDRLAMGGMAEIYKAKTFGAEGFEKLLAIKRILPHCSADQDFIRMLIDEAKLSVLLSHANIVQVYDLGKVGEDYFISMEYINGVNLRELLYRLRDHKRPLPAELTIFILSEVCKGLDYAHRKTDPSGTPLQIVHRDVSPQNILLSYEGEVKLVDFGIAKAAMNMSHTMAGILKGKISYMSPEQALGKQITHHTDIFSVGLILHECLTGQKLFTGDSQFEVLKRIRTTKITAAKLSDTIPAPLRDIIARALAYFPKDRYATAGDLQSDLTRYLYSTAHEFTPQRLAAFVRELFAEELSRQLRQAHASNQRDQNTSSIEVASLVQQPGAAAAAADVSQPSIPLPPERSIDRLVEPHRHVARRFAAIVTVLAVLGSIATGYIYIRFPTWFRAPPALPVPTTGSVIVETTPPGATILVNGQTMPSVAPSTVAQLPLHAPQNLTMRLAGYRDVTQQVTLTSATPVTLQVTLPVATGTMQMTSDPAGATIVINGQRRESVTPATIDALPLGASLVIRLEKEGFAPYEETVVLPDSEPHTLSATLSAGTPALPPSTPIEAIALPDTPTTPPAPPTAAQSEKTPVDRTGRIRVESSPPGALILLNGRSTGQTTPAVLQQLAVGGTYSVAVRKEGFQGWTRSITLRSNAEVTLSQALSQIPPRTERRPPTPPVIKEKEAPVIERTTQETNTLSTHGNAALQQTKTTTTTVETAGHGSISVSSKPRGANVYIDGRMLGRAPLTVQGVSAGKSHTVRVELAGYAPWTTSVRVTADGEAQLAAPLTKAGE